MGLFKKFTSIFKKLVKIKKPKKVEKVKKPAKKPVKKAVPEPKKVAAPKRGEPRPEISGREKPPVKKPPVKRPPVKKKDLREIYKILKEPHISEKATVLTDQNKYVFKIMPRANKVETKKAVENLYGVRVKDVNIINVHRKRKVLRGVEGFKTGYKKAIVTLKEGEKIEIVPR